VAGSSDTYHEPLEAMSGETVDMHRALVSLQEELEAVDWYRQRADATPDESLKAILLHNMREEIEHACMVLEWLRRHNADFEAQLRTYLFTQGEITALEHETEAASPAPEQGSEAGRLTVGSLRGEK